MTIVNGQIESLKKIKAKLRQQGITRFNSISDINNFIRDYKVVKTEIYNQTEHALDLEINDLKSNLMHLQNAYEGSKTSNSVKLDTKIHNLQNKYINLSNKAQNSVLSKIMLMPRLWVIKYRKCRLEKNFEKIISSLIRQEKNDLASEKNKLQHYLDNKENIILERNKNDVTNLDFTKQVVDELYSLIAGAIGENLVVKELSKLSDKYVLFNDYSQEFSPPIYNKKEKDRIFSIQIDHVLIANSGIFILETKNWSKSSIKNLDLRSPVKQVMRTSYALFVVLNSDSEHNEIDLANHHWGNKQIPIRNVIVMIHEKPKESFKYVKVKTLAELNSYITYFDPIFSDEEVKRISEYFLK